MVRLEGMEGVCARVLQQERRLLTQGWEGEGGQPAVAPSHIRTDGCSETDVGWGWAQGTVCFRRCSLVLVASILTTWAMSHLQNHPRDARLLSK